MIKTVAITLLFGFSITVTGCVNSKTSINGIWIVCDDNKSYFKIQKDRVTIYHDLADMSANDPLSDFAVTFDYRKKIIVLKESLFDGDFLFTIFKDSYLTYPGNTFSWIHLEPYLLIVPHRNPDAPLVLKRKPSANSPETIMLKRHIQWYLEACAKGRLVAEIEMEINLSKPAEVIAPSSDSPHWKLKYMTEDFIVLFLADKIRDNEKSEFLYAGKPEVWTVEKYKQSQQGSNNK